MIRIVVAEDHHIVRRCIVSLIEMTDGMEVVGEAADGHEALRQIQKKIPDVAIVDIKMPRLHGVEVTGQVQKLDINTSVVILSAYCDHTSVRRALEYGAMGYVVKNGEPEELMIAIRSAHKGVIYLSPSIAQIIVPDYLQTASSNEALTVSDRLTSRERETLQLIVEGHTNRAIAKLLQVSPKTVEKHRTQLMKKLEATNLPELVLAAAKHRLVYFE